VISVISGATKRFVSKQQACKEQQLWGKKAAVTNEPEHWSCFVNPGRNGEGIVLGFAG
jgi:ribosomal protein S8E